MVEAREFNVDDVRFERVHPRQLAGRFDEIQRLRSDFYSRVFAGRSPHEIVNFVSRLTLDNWSDPNAAVGKTARDYQRRRRPQVVATFDDHSDEILGFMYAAENVSSKFGPLVEKHAPKPVAKAVGKTERGVKILTHGQYVWGSEYVHAPERAGLVPVLGALTLEAYNPNLQGSWFPWDQEADLKAQLEGWGYEYQDEEELEPHKAFGRGTAAPTQEVWKVSRIGNVVEIIEQLPGANEVLRQVRDSLAA